MSADLAIEATGLEKSYGRTRALAGLGLAVQTGTILGVLGPNGSGKTTAVRVLTTLLRPDRGTARVAGYDVVSQATQVRRRIGLAGQTAALDESLTGSANLVMIGQLCRLPRRGAQQRAKELLSRFDLADAADRGVKTYSGGMRRRLDLAASLVSRPPILFLDEPPPVSTPAAVWSCGTSSGPWWPTARPFSSPLSTWKKLTGWQAGSSSSTKARSSPRDPRTS
jgi:ABC-type multidrug transport system ATPase subunit